MHIKRMIVQDKIAKSQIKFVTLPKATEYRKTLAKICNNQL